MRKSKVNHDAVVTAAASNKDIIIILSKYLHAIRMIFDRHDVDVLNEEAACAFIETNGGIKQRAGDEVLTLGRCVKELSTLARGIKGLIPGIDSIIFRRGDPCFQTWGEPPSSLLVIFMPLIPLRLSKSGAMRFDNYSRHCVVCVSCTCD